MFYADYDLNYLFFYVCFTIIVKTIIVVYSLMKAHCIYCILFFSIHSFSGDDKSMKVAAINNEIKKKPSYYLCIFEYSVLIALNILTDEGFCCNNTHWKNDTLLLAMKFIVTLNRTQFKNLMAIFTHTLLGINNYLSRLTKYKYIKKFLLIFKEIVTRYVNKIFFIITKEELLIMSSFLFVFAMLLNKKH